MSRIRTIKPEFFTSADICALDPLARILYIALWCEADREGRLVWSPRTFKIRYMPADDCDIFQLAGDLVRSGLVELYDVGDKKLAYIPSWRLHQNVNPREQESRLPPPPNPQSELNLEIPRVSDASEHASLTGLPSLGKGREGKGRERKTLSSIDDSYRVPAEWLEPYVSKQPEVDWNRDAERFVLHHVSKGSKFKDWKAAWRTWATSDYSKPMLPKKGASGKIRRDSQGYDLDERGQRTGKKGVVV